MLTSSISAESMVLAAKKEISSITPAEADELRHHHDVILIDIRDPRELQQLGKIPGAVNMPRGMLEFGFDASSPYYQKKWLKNKKKAILYCARDWRSALATKALQDMGVKEVVDLKGGFAGWQEANMPIEKVE